MVQHHWDQPQQPSRWEQKENSDQCWERKLQQARETPASGILLGKNLSSHLPVFITPNQLATHMHVVGATGVGKTFFLEGIIKTLIQQGHGACVIDPHGDLYHRILDFCTFVNMARPELKLHERVIPFDISETQNILAFNPMHRNARVMTYQVVALMEAIRKCWGQTTFDATPRLARWLFNTNYAVIDTQATLAQAYDMVDPKPNRYRPAITARINDPRIRAEWEWIASVPPDKREERLESCFNRLRLFVTHEVIRPIVGQYTNTLDFSSVLTGGKILLVNLARQNTISQDDQHMLGTLLVNEVLTAAFARPKNKRTPFFLFVDEFQHFVTKDMCEILDGGRKFGLHLILAHQYLHQLKEKDPEVYYSALGNARIKAVFGGLVDEDLDILAKELYTGEFDPEEIKDEIWQTKFRPVESSRTVTVSGGGESSGLVNHNSLASGRTYIPGSDFWSPGTYTYSSSSTGGSSRQNSSSSSWSQSEVPFYEFHEFKELSSRTFRSLEEQLYIKKAQMKRHGRQHAAILIPDKHVQLVKVPTLKDFVVKDRHREEFKEACFDAAGCFKPHAQATQEIAALEQKLLTEAKPVIEISAREEATPVAKPRSKSKSEKPKSPLADLLKNPIGRE